MMSSDRVIVPNTLRVFIVRKQSRQEKETNGLPNSLVVAYTLKRKCRHFDEIVITDCTGSCHFDNFQCSRWWQFHQNEHISVTAYLHIALLPRGDKPRNNKETGGLPTSLDSRLLDGYFAIFPYVIRSMWHLCESWVSIVVAEGLVPSWRHKWGVLCQKQVPRAGASNYIPQYLWDAITCPCPLNLLLAQHF